MDYEHEAAKWQVKLAELEAEEAALRQDGAALEANMIRSKQTAVAEHIRMLKDLQADRQRQAEIASSPEWWLR